MRPFSNLYIEKKAYEISGIDYIANKKETVII